MLWRFDTLTHFHLRAEDGRIGHIHDLLFEDTDWSVRYVVVDTGSWLFGRRVLIVPHILGPADRDAREFPASTTREMIENAPDVDTAKSVDRQQEEKLHGYFGWPPYWGASAFLGPVLPEGLPGRPPGFNPDPRFEEHDRMEAERADPHLRSALEIGRYRLAARDGDAGHLETCLIDAEVWRIRYLAVNTGEWLTGRAALLPMVLVRNIEWAERRIDLDVTRGDIEASPPVDPDRPVERELEEALYRHFGRPPYW